MDAIWRGPSRGVISPHDDEEKERESTGAALAADLVLIDLARHDPAAFAALYERYYPAVHGYCLRRVTDRKRSADVTSEIFTRAIAALPRFRPQATRRRCPRLALHHRPQRRGRPPPPLPPQPVAGPHGTGGLTPPQLIDAAPLPEEHAIAADERQRLRELLTHLTESQRQVTELRLAGLTGAEIAAVLGLTTGAVKALQFRAFSRLRDLLGGPRATMTNGDGDE